MKKSVILLAVVSLFVLVSNNVLAKRIIKATTKSELKVELSSEINSQVLKQLNKINWSIVSKDDLKTKNKVTLVIEIKENKVDVLNSFGRNLKLVDFVKATIEKTEFLFESDKFYNNRYILPIKFIYIEK